jgi:hypothetical protein
MEKINNINTQDSPCEKSLGNYSFKRIPNPPIHETGSYKEDDNSSVGNKKTKYFYSCPAKAPKYDDHDILIEHVDNMLSDIRGDPWIWMFDSAGFGVKHYLEIRTAQSLAKLISDKYSDSLEQIIVMNPSWHMRLTLNVVWPFLSNKIKNSILIK